MRRGLDPAGTTRRLVLDIAVVCAVTAAALGPLVPVYGTWLLAAAVATGLVLGTAAVAIPLLARWPAWTAVIVGCVGYLGLAGGICVPGSTVAGVVPTAETVRQLVSGAGATWREVLAIEPPVGSGGTVLIAPVLLAALGSGAALQFAWKVRAPAGTWGALGAVTGVGIGALILAGPQPWAAAPLAIGASLAALTWASIRQRPVRAHGALAAHGRQRVTLAATITVALLACAACIAGLTVGPWLGDARPRLQVRDLVDPGFDPHDYPSPLAGYRSYVKARADQEILSVGGLSAGQVVRVAVMDSYDGVVWRLAGNQSAGFRRPGMELPRQAGVPDAPARTTLHVEIHELDGPWLPTAGVPSSLQGQAGFATSLRYSANTGSAALTTQVPDGLTYTEQAAILPVPTSQAIDAAEPCSLSQPKVDPLPDAVVAAASDIARTAATPAATARAAEQFLATSGYFSHGDAAANQAPSLSGHGGGRLTQMLTDKRMVGDAEQYAALMALMLRALGIPARVTMGFQVPDGHDASTPITFTGADMDAWTDVCYRGLGWVAYHPTPEASRTPTADEAQPEPQPRPQVIQPPPPPADEFRQAQADTEVPDTQGRDQLPEANVPVGWKYAAGAGGGVLVLLLPGVLLAAAKARRRRRRRRGSATQQAHGAWQEVIDTAVDLGVRVPKAATRPVVASCVGACYDAPGLSQDLAELAAATDAVVFGVHAAADPLTSPHLWRQSAALSSRLRHAHRWPRAWWSRVTPASLRRSRATRRVLG